MTRRRRRAAAGRWNFSATSLFVAVVAAVLVTAALLSLVVAAAFLAAGEGEGNDAARTAGALRFDPENGAPPAAATFVHVYSPFASREAQLVSASMRRAAEKAAEKGVRVDFVAAAAPADLRTAAAAGGVVAGARRAVLQRSFGVWFPAAARAGLPPIADVLRAAATQQSGRFVVLTNADIVLREDFYTRLLSLLEQRPPNALCVTVNRRTVSSSHVGALQQQTLDSVLRAVTSDPGRPHPGHDCFVFPWEWLSAASRAMEGFVAGAPVWGCWLRTLLCSGALAANTTSVAASAGSQLPCTLEDEYITAHIGDDAAWRNDELSWLWNSAWMHISATRWLSPGAARNAAVKRCRSRNPCTERARDLFAQQSPQFEELYGPLLSESCEALRV